MVFQTFFAPYLFHCSRNNRHDKQTQQVLARKNVQKTKFEATEMMLGPWNQQIIENSQTSSAHNSVFIGANNFKFVTKTNNKVLHGMLKFGRN